MRTVNRGASAYKSSNELISHSYPNLNLNYLYRVSKTDGKVANGNTREDMTADLEDRHERGYL